MKSIGGNILYVNLTTREIRREPTAQYAERYLGGRGVNVSLLFKLVKPWVTPLDPANVLIFGAGTLGGTIAFGSSRLSIETKSPVTGGIGSANAGGYFAPEMKYAGYDHIIITGRSRSPVYLWIDDNRVELKDASHIWGKLVGDTIQVIKGDLKDTEIETACIGPGGENLVRFAHVVVSQTRAAAHCGVGAVMGSKNLKAIAVRGTKPLEVAQPERFIDDVNTYWAIIKKEPVTISHMKHGPIYSAPIYLEAKVDSSRNFQGILDPEKFKYFMPEAFEPYEIRKITSHACPKACFRVYKINDGCYEGTVCNGFPANDLANFAMRFDWDYAPALIKAHDLCNEYGIDEDAASNVIAWAFECYQRGILSDKDTSGLKLIWGDHKAVIELLTRIAYRQGIGDMLAEGSMQASQIINKGSEDFAIHIKGADSMETLRGSRAWALGCVVATRGGTHLRGATLFDAPRNFPDDFRETWSIPKDWDPMGWRGKAQSVIHCENLKGITDSLGICCFNTTWEGPRLLGAEEMAELYSAATGIYISAAEMLKVGDRIHNMEKAFNTIHAGFSRKDDYPPKRFMEEKVQGGIADGDFLPSDKWDIMLDEYYSLRCWDKQTGWQTRHLLESLDMKSVADDLEKVSRLP
ncbi:MAG: aldehyde ferredoxin oxidoreductase family protein [Chloroflexota bacterium]